MPDLYTIGNDLVVALAVARAESGWDYDAKGGPNSNGTFDWGLFQINDVHKPTEAEKTKPLENSRKAYSVYKAAGGKFAPWATYKSKAFEKHIPAAKAAVAELNKRGSDFEKAALEKDGSAVMAPGELENLGPENPLDSFGKLAQDFGNKLFGFFNVSLGVVLGVVLLVLGVVLLSRGFVSRVVAGTVKEAARSGSKATKPAAKAPLSVEEKAARSLDYSAARKRLADERAVAAAEQARELLRERMRKG